MHRLGWRWSRPNDFSGPDQRPVRDTFMELQRYMTWPHIGLRFSGTFAMGNTFTTSIVPASLISTGPDTSDLPDPYSLYRSDTVHCIVPSEFEHWLVVGHATFRYEAQAGPPLRSSGFSINDTANEEWVDHHQPVTVGTARGLANMVERVKRGDKINVCAASSSANDLLHMRAYLIFYPVA